MLGKNPGLNILNYSDLGARVLQFTEYVYDELKVHRFCKSCRKIILTGYPEMHDVFDVS